MIAGDLLDSIIVRDEFSISDMPPVQLSSLFGNSDESISEYCKTLKSVFIDAINLELGDHAAELNSIPSKEELLEQATKETPLDWNAFDAFCRNESIQSEDSFNEQKSAIQLCCTQIDKYCNIDDQSTYTKNVGIRGFPGSGKTWCALYTAIYAMSKGLFVLPTAMLAKRAIQLGGIHYHKLFCIPTEKNISLHRRAELALIQILKDPRKMHILLYLDILIGDEIGQLSDEFVATLDIILRRLRDNSLYLGGVLLICTLDHTQIQAIESRPFLTSTNVIPCFLMIALNHSVRASDDANFFRIQQIARYHHRTLEEKPELIEEFISLCSQYLTFVDDWNNPQIPPNCMRLYSKKVPAKEAAKDFGIRVRQHYPSSHIRERIAEDVEKSRYSQQEWYCASERTSLLLDQKVKEPRSLLFFRGSIFTCTYNDKDGAFSQAQMALLYDLPDQDDIDNWQKIPILVAPPGSKEIIYDATKTKQSYLENGFKEVKMGLSKEYTQSLKNNIQAQRKQYGLKHYVSSTIHAAMGDTLVSMATTISYSDHNFNMWDKGQLVVILSRTKSAKDSIFVGPKNETLQAFRDLLTKKTQWSDYIENVLDLVTVNTTSEYRPRVMTQTTFPYRICDVSLPQCNSGYVYMLLSTRQKNYTYIGTTNCIRSRLQQHNSGNGAVATAPAYLRPFALLAYICGFGGGRRDLRYFIESKWKEKRDEVIQRGQQSILAWARCGETVIHDITNNNNGGDGSNRFGVTESELSLVLLFKEHV